MPPSAQEELPVFAHADGIVIMQLNSSASEHAGVHNVQVQLIRLSHVCSNM